MAIASTVYMRALLPDSISDENLSTPIMSTEKVESVTDSREDPARKPQMFKPLPSMEDVLELLKSRLVKFPFISSKIWLDFAN